MQKDKQSANDRSAAALPVSWLRPFSVLLLMFTFPALSLWIEFVTREVVLTPLLIGKWFIFWGMGIQLTLSGATQLLLPGGALRKRFGLTGRGSFPLVREYGILSLALGVVAITSLFREEYRPAAALAGALFFGLRSGCAVIGKPGTGAELILFLTDLVLFSLILLYLFSTLFIS